MNYYWIVISIENHPQYPITHRDMMYIESFFAEEPKEYREKDDINFDPSGKYDIKNQYIVPSEYAMVYSGGNAYLCHRISEEEYNSAQNDFIYYIWSQPYGSAAFSVKGGHSLKNVDDDPIFGNLSLGRMQLYKEDIKYIGLAAGTGKGPEATIKPDDHIILFELYITDSVVQFIVNEMNKNILSDFSMSMTGLDHRISKELKNSPIIKDYSTGRQFHGPGIMQNIAFIGGGQWDHKPIIAPIWGVNNRLGNVEYQYFYDYWSNIHYGYITAHIGYTKDRSINGAAIFQYVDNFFGTTSDVYDDESVGEGWNLYHRNRGSNNGGIIPVTRRHIIDIIDRNPQWKRHIRK